MLISVTSSSGLGLDPRGNARSRSSALYSTAAAAAAKSLQSRAAHQAPPSLGFSRQEHWSGLPLPSPMHESEK